MLQCVPYALRAAQEARVGVAAASCCRGIVFTKREREREGERERSREQESKRARERERERNRGTEGGIYMYMYIYINIAYLLHSRTASPPYIWSTTFVIRDLFT